MKKILNIVAAAALLFVSGSIHSEKQYGSVPYVGADFQLRHMNFKPNYGGNLFKHDSAQNNIYFGLRVNEYMAAEVGYQSSFRSAKVVNTGPGDIILGCPTSPPGFYAQAITSARMNAYHLNILGFRSLSDNYRLELFGLIGVSSVRVTFERTLVLFNNVPLNIFSKFSTRKNIIRLGGGLEHMITKSCGVRASAIWENTGSLNVNAVTKSPARCRVVKPRNSWTYSFGVFVKF